MIASIISPASIAVVGASNRSGTVGNAAFKNLLYGGFTGVLYPVHPLASSVQGVKAYPTLLDIPDEVDMALVIVAADKVELILQDAARKGIRACIVISAGFKEIGKAGTARENRIRSLVRRCGMRMVGPNCLGVINTDPRVSMNASFARKMPLPGNIAFISQSGALCTSVLDFAAGRHIGFSKFISFGNKADVDEVDLLRHLKDDPASDVILMYLEDITDGRAFMDIAREITRDVGKPILAVKSGRSPEGARAAASHTGSLAGSDVAYDAIFRQSGIKRVEGINELFDYAIAFARQPLPTGNRIAIVTNAGGPGIMATDAAIRHGLRLTTFSRETLSQLKAQLPPTASIHNPVDVIGDATHDRYAAAIRTILADDGVDGAVVILTPQAMTDIIETAEILPPVVAERHKPVLASFMGMVDVHDGINYLEKHGIPNYTFPEAAARTMAVMAEFHERIASKDSPKRRILAVPADRSQAERLIAAQLGDSIECYLTETEATALLACYGFPLLRQRLVQSPSEINAALAEVGVPAVMKIVSPDIVHKSDAGGVRLNIQTREAAVQAFQDIIATVKAKEPAARITAVLLVEMARLGVEVILGATRDPSFGPMCMFGLGGIFVEALKDVTFRLAPMWELSAENMIRSIRGYPVLAGLRGNPPADVEAIKDCLLRLSQMVDNHPEIKELDINPLIVYPEGQGCRVADCRIVLARPNVSASKEEMNTQRSIFPERALSLGQGVPGSAAT